MTDNAAVAAVPQKGFLGWIERVGNRLPDPVVLFLWLVGILVVISVIASALGLPPVVSRSTTA